MIVRTRKQQELEAHCQTWYLHHNTPDIGAQTSLGPGSNSGGVLDQANNRIRLFAGLLTKYMLHGAARRKSISESWILIP